MTDAKRPRDTETADENGGGGEVKKARTTRDEQLREMLGEDRFAEIEEERESIARRSTAKSLDDQQAVARMQEKLVELQGALAAARLADLVAQIDGEYTSARLHDDNAAATLIEEATDRYADMPSSAQRATARIRDELRKEIADAGTSVEALLTQVPDDDGQYFVLLAGKLRRIGTRDDLKALIATRAKDESFAATLAAARKRRHVVDEYLQQARAARQSFDEFDRVCGEVVGALSAARDDLEYVRHCVKYKHKRV